MLSPCLLCRKFGREILVVNLRRHRVRINFNFQVFLFAPIKVIGDCLERPIQFHPACMLHCSACTDINRLANKIID